MGASVLSNKFHYRVHRHWFNKSLQGEGKENYQEVIMLMAMKSFRWNTDCIVEARSSLEAHNLESRTRRGCDEYDLTKGREKRNNTKTKTKKQGSLLLTTWQKARSSYTLEFKIWKIFIFVHRRPVRIWHRQVMKMTIP